MYSCALFEVPRLTAGNNAAQVEKPAENPSPSPEDLDGKLTGARKKTKENSLTEGVGTKMKKDADKVDKKVKVAPSENAAQVEKPAENLSPSPEDLDGKLTGTRKKTKENSLTEGLGTKMKKGADKVDKKVKVAPSENAAQLDKNKQSPIVDVTSRVTDIPCVPKSCTRLKQDLKQLGTDIVNRWLVTLDLSFISIT